LPIHEKSLIRPENLHTHENLEIDGVDVSGDWSTFIQTRVISDYDEDMEDEVAALPGGEYIHRCWQCGSCTNSCTVNALDAEFNPRYWIYLTRLGMRDELLRDKDLIWQCVSCNKCTYACPRDVNPEGVMKALAHWLELKGHTPTSPSTHFDTEFSEQVFATGKIEEGRVIRGFFARTKQPLMQDWLVEMAKRVIRHLPVTMMMRMGLAGLLRPRTSGWGKARDAINEYVAEQNAKHAEALKLGADGGHGAANE